MFTSWWNLMDLSRRNLITCPAAHYNQEALLFYSLRLWKHNAAILFIPCQLDDLQCTEALILVTSTAGRYH